ncbi:MAG: hypothetical protein Q8Q23_00135 [bacterium]|nr:hypothetical protein [bacterium]
MENRQEELLKIIINEYIKNAEPVSSGFLVNKFNLPYSPATVRNELVKLEKDGYIFQPHTSAGRVPTEKGFNFFIKNFLKLNNTNKKNQKNVNLANEMSIKQAAKSLAEESGLAVFWALHRNNVYYTGISNLLSQPEFCETQKVIDISRVIDHIDEIINEIFKDIKYSEQILIGENNPFGAVCGSVIIKYKNKDVPSVAKAMASEDGMLGIIGPMRMDYEKCVALINGILLT